MEYQNTADALEKKLARLIGWIQSVDARVLVVLPLMTAMLGVLAVLAPKASEWTIASAVASAFAAFFLILSVIFSAFATFPRTVGPKGSLIYFGGIASMELEQYKSAFMELTMDKYMNDMISQCHRNAQIAEKKYKWLQRAMICVFASSVPWVVAVYLLYNMKT